MNPFSSYDIIVSFVWLNFYSWTYVSLEFILDDCLTPNNVGGVCVNIWSCESLLLLLQEKPRPSQKSIEFLRRSHCGFEGRTPIVCCPKPESKVTEEIQNFLFTDVQNHENVERLIPSNCGSLFEDRITNGNTSSLYEFPWMALLGYTTRSGLQYRCGGSLISNRYVLTAAHCVTNLNDLKLQQVRLGEYNLATDTDCQPGRGCAPPSKDFEVEEVISHPKYLKSELRNDIALIRLKKEVEMGLSIQPVCLPIGLEEQKKTLEGNKVIVTGWGTTEKGTNSQILMKATVPVVPVNECSKIYDETVPVNEKQICAGGVNGVDSCTGDSGGPLQAVSRLPSREFAYVQFGVVSFGPRRCGMKGKPGVYTRVGFYMDWILNTMKP